MVEAPDTERAHPEEPLLAAFSVTLEARIESCRDLLRTTTQRLDSDAAVLEKNRLQMARRLDAAASDQRQKLAAIRSKTATLRGRTLAYRPRTILSRFFLGLSIAWLTLVLFWRRRRTLIIVVVLLVGGATAITVYWPDIRAGWHTVRDWWVWLMSAFSLS
jgi:hypothetical protein